MIYSAAKPIVRRITIGETLMESIQIALDPALGISPEAFAEAWNAAPEGRALAQADLRPVPGIQFDPSLAEAAFVVLNVIVGGIAGNATYDIIKELLFKQGVTRRTRIELHDLPDGTKMTVITIDEEA